MYKRQLEFISDSRELKKPHLIMRVMSYNVLADHLLWEHPKLYLQCQPHHKDFTERGEKIIKTITRQDPTVRPGYVNRIMEPISVDLFAGNDICSQTKFNQRAFSNLLMTLPKKFS